MQALRGCGFREALKFLARMAGLPAGDLGSRGSARAFSEQRKQRERVEQAADKLARAERYLRLKYGDALRQLEASQRRASELLSKLLTSSNAASLSEREALCQELQDAVEKRRILIAGYYLLSFGRMEDRVRFVMQPGERAAMIAARSLKVASCLPMATRRN